MKRRATFRTRLLAATLAAALAPAWVSAAPPTAVASDRMLVRTADGPVLGKRETGYVRFSAIPYAAPPVGDLRWRSPAPAVPWKGVLDASRAPSPCPQTGGQASENEDCLYLNVFAPAARPDSRPLPVMVWVHGGGFTTGDGASYLPSRMVQQGGVIVVTINYRLGIFGNLAMPGLANAGAFGIEDQQAALRWVRRNAAAFGGDPRNVTLFGESAGGMSTCAHLGAPGSVGLFDKAIVQSGSCYILWRQDVWWPGVGPFAPYIAVAETEELGRKTAADAGCTAPADALACLRRVPTTKLMELAGPYVQVSWGGKVLPRDPAQALTDGPTPRIPIMFGGTRGEHRPMVAALDQRGEITAARYGELLPAAFGAAAARVEQVYPLSAFPNPATAWATVTTDASWACPNVVADKILSQRTKVFAFEFADPHAPSPSPVMVNSPRLDYGAGHASELTYLFDLGGAHAHFTPEQESLAAAMIRYWTRFAATGDPAGPGDPPWPVFAKGEQALSLAPGDGGIRLVDLAAEHHCAFWAAVPKP